MQKMTPSEYRSFLLEGTRTAKVATTKEDGQPHNTPVWFLLDEDEIVFTTWHESVKAKNLRRDPRLALCVDDQVPLYSFVMIEGTATISSLPGELKKWATRIGARYMGEDRAEEYGERNSVEGELLIRVKPTKIVAQKDLAE